MAVFIADSNGGLVMAVQSCLTEIISQCRLGYMLYFYIQFKCKHKDTWMEIRIRCHHITAAFGLEDI